MKKQSLFLGLFTLLFISLTGFAQKSKTTSENIKVWGNCGMCKKTIETAAKSVGATEANWNEETKILAVSYNPSKADNKKIQKAIAAVGYDTQDFTAPDDAYFNLHECCQYDRKANVGIAQQAVTLTTTSTEKASCCDMEKCGKEKDCCKDMKCCDGKDPGKNMACCKDGANCCKDGKSEKGKESGKAKDMQACKEKCCKS
jgi:periplasmic mercuric ion binding protein